MPLDTYVIVNNATDPSSAIVASVSPEQLPDFRAAPFNPITVEGTLAPILSYVTQPGFHGSEITKNPISPENVHYFSPTMGRNIQSKIDSGTFRRFHLPVSYTVDGPIRKYNAGFPYLESYEWQDAEDEHFSLSVHRGNLRMGRNEHRATIFYGEENAGVRVTTQMKHIPKEWYGRIVKDDSGLYQEPTVAAVQERIRIAEGATERMDRWYHRFISGSKPPYAEELAVAKAIAGRMPQGEAIAVTDEHFEALYDAAWRTNLRKELPTLLPELRMDISQAIHSSDRIQSQFEDSLPIVLEKMVEYVASGKVDAPDGEKKLLAEVVVLYSRHKEETQTQRITSIKSEIDRKVKSKRKLEKEIAQLSTEVYHPSGGKTELQLSVEANRKELVTKRDDYLTKLNVDPERIAEFVPGVEPDEIPLGPDDDDIPF